MRQEYPVYNINMRKYTFIIIINKNDLRKTYSEEFRADHICLDIEFFLGYRKLRNSSSPETTARRTRDVTTDRLTSGKKSKTIKKNSWHFW